MTRRWHAASIKNHKGKKPPLVCLALANAYWARLADGVVDLMLVGDSLAMTIYGKSHTHDVTLAMMTRHAKAVVAASSQSMVVVDVPRESRDWTFDKKCEAYHRLLKETGAQAVKIEGGATVAKEIAALIEQGIPVMGHVGLMPQYSKTHRVAGQDEHERAQIIADAHALSDAGVFALVVECVPQSLAEKLTERISVPVIGIGGAPQCDGQIIVAEDILSLTEHQPRFVRRYGDIATIAKKAFNDYASDVRKGKFPKKEECYEDK